MALAQQALVGALPVRRRALEVGEILLRAGHRLGSSATAMSTTPFGDLHLHRTHLIGS